MHIGKGWGNFMIIPKPVWTVGFALEQTLHVVALTVFSYVDFKVASAYKFVAYSN
ncbi:MAG: hypothetical protein LBH59_02535 [Planctomycetaceae bacterium]|nr:hypothetical protein [Planctomycetaceae bacterium]